MKTQNTILKAINYLDIYAKRSEKFNDFKYIGKSIDNPLKVSFIKQEKIESLKDYANVTIKGTTEQRKKYFTITSINKLLSQMFIDEKIKTERISQDIDKQLRKDFISNDDLFFENDLKRFYSQELKNYIYVPTGSCMDKKPSSYFEIYENFINVKTQIVGLKVGKVVIARAILWTKTDKETKQKKYYLDRIYISKDFENSHKAYLQSRLFNKVKRALKINFLNCYSYTHIKQYLKDTLNEQQKEKASKEYLKSKCYPDFKIQINADTFYNLDYKPYLDTFRWGEELRENISFDMNEDNRDIVLDCTSGGFSENDNNIECAYDGEYYHEDDMCYSDIDDCYYYTDNCVWIEERETYCNIDEATYNNYTEQSHYNGDLGL